MTRVVHTLVTRCGDCPLAQEWCGGFYCNATKDAHFGETGDAMPDWCPLRDAPIRVSLASDEPAPDYDRPLELD